MPIREKGDPNSDCSDIMLVFCEKTDERWSRSSGVSPPRGRHGSRERASAERDHLLSTVDGTITLRCTRVPSNTAYRAAVPGSIFDVVGPLEPLACAMPRRVTQHGVAVVGIWASQTKGSWTDQGNRQ